MIADSKWIVRNIGFDPIVKQAPASTFSFAPAADSSRTLEDIQREIIEFDSESSTGKEFFAFSKATGLSQFTDIKWPRGLKPKVGPKPSKSPQNQLPKADVLVVTWTVDEGHALSRVLTNGVDSRNDYIPYRHKFKTITRKMRKGCPALQANRLGSYWTAKIGKKKVVLFKSDSHLSQDIKKLPSAGTTLPNFDLWKQLIAEVQPKLVITTGTAGGIGTWGAVGDVVVSPVVRLDSLKWLRKAPFHDAVCRSSAPKKRYFKRATQLFKANAHQLPPDNKRPPKIVVSATTGKSVVTTDFFGFDTSNNHYQLQGLGDVSEMGDVILGLVASQMAHPPRWVAVRNVSDPQIKAQGSIKDQATRAAHIYKAFGRWSSVCSAIVCWALIAAE